MNVVQCFNTSTVDSGSVVYSVWNFGDGTASVNTQGLTQPTHTYTASGLYYICLQVISVVPGTTTITCGDSICHSVQVQAPSTCTLVANFTTTATSSPMSFIFQNTSTGYAAGDSIRWSFGDGSVSYDANPTHTYANYGTYNVCLRVKKNPTPAGATPCVSEICHTITIANPNPCTLVPALTVAPSPNATNAFVFTNTSTPAPSTATWNFGDSTFGSGNVVTHSYAQPGVYRVCMTVVVNNTCIRDTCITITVNNITPPPCSVIPRFTITASQSQPGLYFFTNTSTVSTTTGTSVVWSFGDSTTATGNNVSHTYTHSGTYNVCLHVSVNNNACAGDTCGTVVVNIPTSTCNITPSFNFTRSTTATNTFEFRNTSSGMTAGAVTVWNFGDGTSATGNVVIHTFNQSNANYNICMTVTDSGCTRTTCHYVSSYNSCSLTPSFSFSRSSTATNTFEFRNTSSGMSAGAIAVWSFGDGTSDTGNIVHHTYSQSGGGYYVCMKVIDSACTRSTCRYVSTANYLLAYPNPAQTNVNVNINLSQSTPIYAYIYNSQGMLVGQLLQQGIQGNNLLTFNVAGLPAGYYTIRIYTANGVFITRFQKI